MPDLAARILDAVRRPGVPPAKPKALAKRLGIHTDEDYARFRKTLKDLIKDGHLELGRHNAVVVPDLRGTFAGLYRRTQAGLGLVRPHKPTAETGSEVRIRDGRELDASTGDEVLVKISRASGKARSATGEIVRVLARATRSFVGTYFERDGIAFVRVDGTQFAQSIEVGDPGSKGAKPQDKVVVELIRFPTPEARGEGVVTEVLGSPSEPGVDLLTVIRAFHLPEAFPETALAEARDAAANFAEGDLSHRVDYTRDCVLTIDPATAKDFDDAISVTRDAKGFFTLTVHIADVAHFVKPGGALDAEARKRGTSVYLPGRVIPMLPEVISNGLASLQEGRLRYVKSARMEFATNGKRLQAGVAEFTNGAIRARKRFAYEDVQALFNQLDATPEMPTPDGLDPQVFATLQDARQLAAMLRARRFKRGSLELTLPAAELETDADGRVCGAHFAVQDESHRLIEEFMLAANEAVAERFAELKVPFLRRVHPAPNPEKLGAFAEFSELLGYPLDRVEDRFELQRVLRESADKPERAAIHYALLRSLKQATYSPVQDEHFALASRHYCHFTSPIRRYPDLLVHRQLDRWLRTKKGAGDEGELKLLGDHCSRLERRAEQAERECIKLKILHYFQSRLGTVLDATITGVAEYGFFALATQFPAEGLVPIATLADDYYIYDESSHSLFGSRSRKRYRLGDPVRVEVARVDVARRQLDFRLTAEQPTSQQVDAPRARFRSPRPKRGKPRRGGD